jgi:hypothetical protein
MNYSRMSDLSVYDNLTVNNNLVVGDTITSNDIVSNNTTSNIIHAETLVLKSQDVDSRLLTIENDVKVMEGSVNDLTSTKADITYVNTQIANLIGGATESYDILVEIQTLLQEDDTQIDSLFTAVGLRALDANTVHKTGTEIITGQKQMDGGLILNSNLKANDINLTPLEVSRLTGIQSAIQPQLDTHTTNIANLQPQQTSITATTVLNNNYRTNCWFLITAATSINITLPAPTSNIAKVFWFTNQSTSACNIIGNGSNTIKYESTAGTWASVASITITANASLALCFKSDGYVVLYNSNVLSGYSGSTNTAVSNLQGRTQMLTSNGVNSVITKSTIGPDNTSTLAIVDNPSSSSRALSVFPNIASKTYTSLVEQSDILLLASNNLTIAPLNGQKTLGVRMTQDDLILSSSTASTSDNKIVMNATNKTMNFTSPNWVGFNNAVACPDVILNSTSLAQTLTGLGTKTQMVSFDSGVEPQ